MQDLSRTHAERADTGNFESDYTSLDDHSFDQFDNMKISSAFVFYNDRTENERREWVDRVFPGHISFEMARIEQLFSAVNKSRFNVLLVGSNDTLRVAKMLRDHINIILDTPKILLVKAMSPADRAVALMAGFDDVIDYTRATPAEVIARVRGMVRRYQISAANSALRDLQESNLTQIADARSLSVREQRVLEALAKRRGRPVSYEFLCEQISQDVVGASALYLRVVICCLRKKLRNGATIVARLGQGYELTLDPGVS